MDAVATNASIAADRPPSWPVDAASPMPAERGDESLSIVIPTFNEAGNIAELLRRIAACLVDVDWTAIVVDDDSPDGTAEVVRRIGAIDPRIRCLQRIGRRGLSSACLEGMAMARGRFLAVIDADLQHDARLLPRMLQLLAAGNLDLVVGSRYMDNGTVGSWRRSRRWLSRAATRVARALLAIRLTDPMSGFFMIRREAVARAAPRLSDSGFKLLLDLVASSPSPLRAVELPYAFAPRAHGLSKLDAGVMWSFIGLLLRQCLRRACERFGRFCLIGTSGIGVHLLVLEIGVATWHLAFPAAQTLAVLVSMTSNYALNNRFTFDANRLRGVAFLNGLSRFAALCALGAVLNVAVADVAMRLVGLRLPAAALGILAGALCNYALSSVFVWRRRAAIRP